MEKKINRKLELYITTFKDEVKTKIQSLNFQLNENKNINDLLEFIYDYNRLTLDKEDFAKRKRVKNSIPNINRCVGKRANGEQCTRRRKEGYEFCGTHCKNIPHGSISVSNNDIEYSHSIDVFAIDIKGIYYYIDKSNNVYNTEDILGGIENPRIIATAIKNENDIYSIPELGI